MDRGSSRGISLISSAFSGACSVSQMTWFTGREGHKVEWLWWIGWNHYKKHKANNVYIGKGYHKLDNTPKNTISNEFNSILDLTDNDDHPDSQKSAFTKGEWIAINDRWNVKKNWPPLDNHIKNILKDIEKMANKSIKEAYKECLYYQRKFAMTEEETFLKCMLLCKYLCVFKRCNLQFTQFTLTSRSKTINKKQDILQHGNTEFTEEDYVVNVWSKVFSSVFDDGDLTCKWYIFNGSKKNITLIHIICLRGDSVSKESTASRRHKGSSLEIDDNVDLRVCCQVEKATVDLINVEFARNVGKVKFFADHRKILWEAKNSEDQLYNSPFLSNHTKWSTQGHCIQIFGVEDQRNQVKLVDDGLYVARGLGSLRLPTCGSDIYKARILLEQPRSLL